MTKPEEDHVSRPTFFALRALALSLAIAAAGCSSLDSTTKLTRELLSLPKEEAYAKGEALLAKKRYDLGRQYIRFVAENYANDAIGKQAALRLADSFFDEHTSLGYIEALVRYRDFRNRYPSHPKSDYALFRLARCSDLQAEKPDRDQTNTRLAVSAYRELLQTYPDSPYATEARARMRTMADLLAEHEYRVGHFYYRRGSFTAAKSRFEGLLAVFPEYAHRDQVLFEAGWIEKRQGREETARTLWERLVQDYPGSPLRKKLPTLTVVVTPTS